MSALHSSNLHHVARCALALACTGYALISQAQSLCSSEGTPPAKVLLERFISADCTACWRDSTTVVPTAHSLAVDWIAPGQLGDEAPLSVAAMLEATDRLQQLGLPKLLGSEHNYTALQPWPGTQLTLAFGPRVGRYVGVSVEFDVFSNAAPLPDLQLWLLVLEQLPAGSEGSPVPRQLVRNVLQLQWNAAVLKGDAKGTHLSELRAMSLPEGTQPQRLQLAAWVQNAQGHLIQTAHTACAQSEAL